MEKIKVAFVFQVGSFWPSWDSLYNSCITDERMEVKLFWINDISGDVAQMVSAESFLKKRGLRYEIFNYDEIISFMPHYMIYQTPYDQGHRKSETWTYRFARQGIRIVYIPYGIEISDTEESRYKHFSMAVVRNAFNIYVMSEDMRKEYIKYCHNAKAVRVFGLPRFDELYHKNNFPLRKELKSKIDGRRVVLWKAHFPKIFIENGIKKMATPRLEEYHAFVEYIQQQKDLFFIFMPHPKFSDDTIEESLRIKARQLLHKLEVQDNVYIDRKDDYRYSLLNADAVIVDRSAVMVEAGVLGVPVLYMNNETFYEPMTEPIQDILDSYYYGTSAKEMVEFCEDLKKGIDRKKGERQEIISKRIPFFDGKCGERIKENLIKEGKNHCEKFCTPKLRNCRFLLFGSGYFGEICHGELEKTGVKEKFHSQIVAFIDNDKTKQGGCCLGTLVKAPEEIETLEYDYIVVTTDRYFNEIHLQLTKEFGVLEDKILTYDQYIVLVNFYNDKI